MKISPAKREEIRMMFGGRCAYCGCELPMKGWHMDHVDPVSRCYSMCRLADPSDPMSGYIRERKLKRLDNPNADSVENLWPSCQACNINKSSSPLETWRKFLMDGPESLASYNGRFRHMVRFGVVQVNPKPLEFWFEKYNRGVVRIDLQGIA
jgi:hypothetical protein